MVEVLLKAVIDRRLKGRARDWRVIGPHDAKLEAIIVGGRHKGLLKRLMQHRTHLVVPIPVENKSVNAMVGGRADFFGHHVRQRLILVAPGRHLRLLVAGETRRSRFDHLPLVLTQAVIIIVAGRRVPVRKVVDGHLAGSGRIY